VSLDQTHSRRRRECKNHRNLSTLQTVYSHRIHCDCTCGHRWVSNSVDCRTNHTRILLINAVASVMSVALRRMETPLNRLSQLFLQISALFPNIVTIAHFTRFFGRPVSVNIDTSVSNWRNWNIDPSLVPGRWKAMNGCCTIIILWVQPREIFLPV